MIWYTISFLLNYKNSKSNRLVVPTCTAASILLLLRAAWQQSIRYMAVDYPHLKSLSGLSLPGLHSEVQYGTRWCNNPNSIKTLTLQKHLSRNNPPKPQTTAEGFFKSGCHIVFLSSHRCFFCPYWRRSVYLCPWGTPNLTGRTVMATVEAAAGWGPIIDRL